MKLRSDSPFKNISQEMKDFLMEFHETKPWPELADMLEREEPQIFCSVPALKRFVRRLKEEALLEEAEEGADVMEKLAARGNEGVGRDGAIEATRQRLLSETLESNDQAGLLEMFKAMNEEKVREQMVEVERRKVKVAEENAKVGWRKLELAAAQSALRLLPEIREALMDTNVSAEERVRRALHCLTVDGGALLLKEGGGGGSGS